MEVVTGSASLRRHLAPARRACQPLGLVPTMGAFHEGHLSLMRRARAECGFVAVSLFVNPTQFAPGEDLGRYPRDFEADCRLAREAGVDLLYAPPGEAVYPPGFQTFVEVMEVSQGLCGERRPGHFRGVATVVAKLLILFRPERAYFGEKDIQQLRVIERLARDLELETEIVPCPTVREPDGLALSSRNRYLSPEERRAAPALHRALLAARERRAAGERDPAALAAAARAVLEREPLVRVEYLEVRDAATLAPVERVEAPAVIAAAAYVGGARLIDNLVLGEGP